MTQPPRRLSDLTGERAFMRLWGARVLGTAAQQMLMVAIRLAHVRPHRQRLGPGAGGAVPVRARAACLAAQGAVALALLAAHLGGHDARALLLGLSLVLGAVRAFQMPAQQSLTPLLVPTALLPRAMAFSSAGQQAAIIGLFGARKSTRLPGTMPSSLTSTLAMRLAFSCRSA